MVFDKLFQNVVKLTLDRLKYLKTRVVKSSNRNVLKSALTKPTLESKILNA